MKSRGFNLMESVVAFAVLGLAFLFILNLFPSAHLASTRGGDLIEADLLASSLAEELRVAPFDELVPGPLVVPSFHRRGTEFEPEITISDPTGTGRVRQVDIVIRWKGRSLQHQMVRCYVP